MHNITNSKEKCRMTSETKITMEQLTERCQELEAAVEIYRDQREKLILTIGHMRRIARPYPQWERWWSALGGEYIQWLDILEKEEK